MENVKNTQKAMEDHVNNNDIELLKKQLAATSETEITNTANERKTLTWQMRNEIFKKVIEDYSMLKKDKGIFHAQLMHAMDTYTKACIDTGYKIV